MTSRQSSQNADQKQKKRSPAFYNVANARELARKRLPKIAFDFIDGATGQEICSVRNMDELQAIKLVSRALVDVSNISTTTEFLGQVYDYPFGIAPMGMCNIFWPGADEAISRAAISSNIPHCVSTAASTALEDSFSIAGTNIWFQLYAGTNEEMTEELVSRAERSGCQTLVFTIDTPMHSRRVRDQKNGFEIPFKIGVRQFLDFATHPYWSISSLIAGPPSPMNFATSALQAGFARKESRGGSDWKFLEKLRNRWKRNLVIKGILSAEDAIRSLDCGVDAIYVSNHGGRQLDSAPAAIEALPKIREAVGENTPIAFDSGIRSSDDIIRALALGANFVLIGRPVAYALGARGRPGMDNLMHMLTEDIRIVMAQLGKTSIDQIDSSVLFDS